MTGALAHCPRSTPLTTSSSSISASRKSFSPTTPTVALALGGGSARGLAHILMLEAIDELGIVPTKIVGTSIGSIMGSCYAAGMSGLEIRAYCEELLASRISFLKRFGKDFPDGLAALWSLKSAPVMDGVSLFEIVMPDEVHCDFASLKIPFTAVTTDYYAIEQVNITHGPVIPAITASSSLPTMMRPVTIGGRVLIDGGFVNPTPFDEIVDKADITVAVDVTGTTGRREGGKYPGSLEAWVGATQILFHSITREKLKSAQPDIFIRPDVGEYSTLDFLRIKEIFKASEPAKDELKRKLDAAFEAYIGSGIKV